MARSSRSWPAPTPDGTVNQKVEPSTSRALDADLTAHAARSAACRSRGRARCRRIPARTEPSTWLKRWNRRGCLSAGNADAGVGHREPKDRLGGARLDCRRSLSVTPPLRRELDGVVEEVEQHLAQAGLVADEQRRQAPDRGRRARSRPFCRRARLHDRHGFVDQRSGSRRAAARARSGRPRSCEKSRMSLTTVSSAVPALRICSTARRWSSVRSDLRRGAGP